MSLLDPMGLGRFLRLVTLLRDSNQEIGLLRSSTGDIWRDRRTPSRKTQGLAHQSAGHIAQLVVFDEQGFFRMLEGLNFPEAVPISCTGLNVWIALFRNISQAAPVGPVAIRPSICQNNWR